MSVVSSRMLLVLLLGFALIVTAFLTHDARSDIAVVDRLLQVSSYHMLLVGCCMFCLLCIQKVLRLTKTYASPAVVEDEAAHSADEEKYANRRIVFSHASRNKSDVATQQVEEMIESFVAMGIPSANIMHQYSMNIAPGQHWADVWMAGMQDADVVITMIDEAYLKSDACVTEFLCSESKQQAIVVCNAEEYDALRSFRPTDGATGCGRVVMALSSGKQLYIKGPEHAAEDIMSKFFGGDAIASHRAITVGHEVSPPKAAETAAVAPNISIETAVSSLGSFKLTGRHEEVKQYRLCSISCLGR